MKKGKKNVVKNDERTLSDGGFEQDPDTGKAGENSLDTVESNSNIDIDAESEIDKMILSHSKGGLCGILDSSLVAPKVVISNIFFDGLVKYVESDEYIEISNEGTSDADISDWKINASRVNNCLLYTSPSPRDA